MSIINDKVNEDRIRLKTDDEQYNYGLNKEKDLINILNDNGNTFQSFDRYKWCDFVSITNDVNIFLELKSRTINRNTYETTFLAKNKVVNYLKSKDSNKKNYFFIIFGFKEMYKIDLEYYYIQYNSNFKDFKTYFNPKENNKPYYLVPVNQLKPLDCLLKSQLFKSIRNNQE